MPLRLGSGRLKLSHASRAPSGDQAEQKVNKVAGRLRGSRPKCPRPDLRGYRRHARREEKTAAGKAAANGTARVGSGGLKAGLEGRMASRPKMGAEVLGRRVVRTRRSVEGTLTRVGGPPSITPQPPNGPNHRADLAHTAS